MAGFQEILIVVAIVLGIFFIPRIMSKRPAPRAAKPKQKISGKMRIAIAAYHRLPHFPGCLFSALATEFNLVGVLIGIVPVLLGWLVVWVFAGFRKP